jgi:hypothetical protein
MGDISIKTIWSDKATNSEINDFRDVVNTVFGYFCTEDYFKRKYLDNIYGPSLLIIVYENDKPVGANGLWRNDIDGKKAYHSVDTSVKQSDNKVIVFAIILKSMLEFLSEQKDSFLYAFPNSNSFSGFKKMKWNVKIYRKVFFIPGLSSETMLHNVESKYALWWLKGVKGICHIKRMGRYYLIKTVQAKGIARVLGRVDKQTAILFPKPQSFIFILYCESEKQTFYNKKWPGIPLVDTNDGNTFIPFYKMDSI